MNVLLINGLDAYDTWGVKMGEGFLDALNAPCEMKDYIENDSRNEHGKRLIPVSKVKARDITLQFIIEGRSKEEFNNNKKNFFDMLYNANVVIQIPRDSEDKYYLIYSGKSVTYSQNILKTLCKLSAKFIEPNPMHKT